MPITPTYPGIYIQELPNSSHAITSAATSIAVFVGYTHPFATVNFGKPVRLFSFTDYESQFGGLYQNDVFPAEVAYAVNEFFLNGGSDCYVVGLNPQYHAADGTLIGSGDPIAPFGKLATTGGGIVFTGKEPTDSNHPMTITITKARSSAPPALTPLDLADVVITYGARAETFRSIRIGTDVNATPNHIETVLNAGSNLVSVSPDTGGYGTAFTSSSDMTTDIATQTPTGFDHILAAVDFTGAFAPEGPLDKLPIFNLLILPGVTDFTALTGALVFAESKRAFVIMDTPSMFTADNSADSITNYFDVPPKGENGAIYFPWIATKDPLTGKDITLPPSGYVAGVYARTDTNRGVWKAPAGLDTTLNDAIGVVESGRMTDNFHGVLNNAGFNALRTFPGLGTVVFGARTLRFGNPAFEQWYYVPVRRMAFFIEQSLLGSLGWAIFEPNDEPLWTALRTTVEAFMLGLFQQGALQGTTPSQAFKVVCDSTTTTPADVANGIVNILVAFAPLKPAEFVIIKIAQLAGQAQS